MIVVIFELETKVGQKQNYLDIATELKPLLSDIDGFISIERFQSLSEPHKLLSISYWRDEEAVITWRNNLAHRLGQQKGREYIFSNYQLRVASVLRDYAMTDRQQVPDDSLSYHDK